MRGWSREWSGTRLLEFERERRGRNAAMSEGTYLLFLFAPPPAALGATRATSLASSPPSFLTFSPYPSPFFLMRPHRQFVYSKLLLLLLGPWPLLSPPPPSRSWLVPGAFFLFLLFLVTGSPSLRDPRLRRAPPIGARASPSSFSSSLSLGFRIRTTESPRLSLSTGAERGKCVNSAQPGDSSS